MLKISQQLLMDWHVHELPQNGSQLGHVVEREAVIDAPHFAGGIAQAMSDLAIGVVGDLIEQHEPLDFQRAFAPETARIPLFVLDQRCYVELNASNPVRSG